jgi:hypothetical protein
LKFFACHHHTDVQVHHGHKQKTCKITGPIQLWKVHKVRGSNEPNDKRTVGENQKIKTKKYVLTVFSEPKKNQNQPYQKPDKL